MNKILFLILILCSFCICGCWSLPRSASLSQLHSITKVEKRVKSGFGKRKVTYIKDFRENEKYEEDIIALKAEVGKYILAHPELSGTAKDNLKELKVTAGATREEVRLLLGEPDKLIKRGSSVNSFSEIWVYRINKRSSFVIVVIPVLITHDGYYLYFQDDMLTTIERHYLEQVIKTGSPSDSEKRSKD